MSDGPASDPHALVDHLFRSRAGQMIAWLTRVFGPAHLGLVEEVVQDALVKALQQWPFSGIPDNPAGWLFRVARNGALDALRRNAAFANRADAIAFEIAWTHDVIAANDDVRDDELRMIFLCCHPSLPPDARVALSLKTVGGFSVAEIARGLLSSEQAVAQRLVRAKRQLRDPEITIELPGGTELASRLDSVLEVIYLLFNEGYSAHEGDDLVRHDLCVEALRLARIVADSNVSSPGAQALAALIALQAARLPARVDRAGELVLLEDQDRSLWDERLVSMGFTYLERSAEGTIVTTYHVQAAIAAQHAGSPPDATPWPVILGLYDELMALNPSPIVALNRAVALSKVEGPGPALEALAAIEREPRLAGYYLTAAMKGRWLNDLGDRAAAAEAYRVALSRPCNAPERRFLQQRLNEILTGGEPTCP
jgi:RNA polymerase sigma-70 factor (ECF subfamily)